MKPTFIEMFCGIGGFRLGLERSGWRCVWANDNDKYACQIYRKNFGGKELVEADIRTVEADSIPDHTLLTAGFPCQSFSLAGKRKGFEDTRGTLFYDIARVAGAKRPPLLLLENVRGILSNDGGRTFARILQALDGLGYDVEWQVLNSKYFGVPQNRERVFIVGHLRGAGSQQVFPIGETRQTTCEEEGRIKTIGNFEPSGYREGGLVVSDKGVSTTLRGTRINNVPTICQSVLIQSQGWEGNHLQIYDGHHKRFTKKMGTLTGRENRQGTNWLVMLSHTKANIKQRQQNRADTWTLDGTSGKMAVAQPIVLGNIYPSNGEAGKIHSANGIFSTLKQGKRGGKAGVPPIVDGARIRRLTPVECERLQGFPDGWTEGVSDTQRYRLLGNAVTVNVAEFLGARLLGCLQ